MSKILCIDDKPEELLSPDGKSLKDTLKSIFKETEYDILFAKTPEKGINLVCNDGEIKLVLVDLYFGKKALGPEIVEELENKAPSLKVIALTIENSVGRKISFGKRSNVVQYICKKDFYSCHIQERFKNLTMAVIEDYYNKTWELEYRESARGDVVNLKNPIRLKNHPIDTFSINISEEYLEAIRECIQSPNEPIDISNIVEPSRQYKIVHDINKAVCEKTNWHTWGLLSREGCGKAQIRLLIDKNNATLIAPVTRGDIPYVTRKEFSQFRDEINLKLEEIKRQTESKDST